MLTIIPKAGSYRTVPEKMDKSSLFELAEAAKVIVV